MHIVRKGSNENGAILLKFSLISALFFAAFAVTSYQSVFLMESGYNSSEIGTGMAIGGMVGMLVLPVWGMISDRIGSARNVLMFSVAMNGLLYFFFPSVVRASGGRILTVYSYIAFTTLFKQPANAMLDAWSVSEFEPRKISYGKARMWGSIGYSLVSLFLGASVGTVFRTEYAFYIMMLFVIPLFFLCWSQPVVKRTGIHTKFNAVPLLRNPCFLIYVLYTLGLNIYLSVTVIYMGYILEHAGCARELVGLVTGFRALWEIISMRFSWIVRKRWPMAYILMLSGILHGTEHLMYRMSNGLVSVMALMILSGLAGGIFYTIGPSYVHDIVEPEVRNTAQSIVGMSMALTGIIGNLFGGYIANKYGITALTTGCGTVIVSLTILFVVWNLFWLKGKR